VISEVSASEVGPLNNYNNNNNTFPQNDLPTRIKRLKSGIAVIKYGRSGQPKNRILRIDERGDRLYWLDAKNINKPNDLAKSINFVEVIYYLKLLIQTLITDLLFSAKSDKAYVVYPNSGRSWDASKKEWIGNSTAGFDNKLIKQWIDAGVQIIGGCCGIGATEIAAISF
jgi:hypothetical protein